MVQALLRLACTILNIRGCTSGGGAPPNIGFKMRIAVKMPTASLLMAHRTSLVQGQVAIDLFPGLGRLDFLS
jgi:hypothetical protein